MLALVVLCFIGLVGAQTTPASQGCCVANKFTTTLLQLSATLAPNSTTPTINDGYILLDYDYDNKMSRLEMHTLNQNTSNYDIITIINDYPNLKTYTETQGRCFVTPMSGAAAVMTAPCLQGNFSHLRTYKLGTGPSAITADNWGGVVQGQRVFIHVQPVDCTPIAQSTYGDTADGTREMTSYLFADVEQNKLSSTNPFALSDACKSATPTNGKRSLSIGKRSMVSYFA